MNKDMCLCPRCTGFYIGVTTFTVLMALLHFYGAPGLSNMVAYVLFVIGLLSFMPAALHGISRRYYNKDLSPKVSVLLLYVSGFLTALGGFFVALAFITLWK
jgi:uncharacterized membrane protein